MLYDKKKTKLVQFPGAKGGRFQMPDSVETLAAGAFQMSVNVTNITISKKVTRIPAEAFSYCVSLRTVTIPSRVKSIGAYAFTGCANLGRVTIPKNVRAIGKSAFSTCTAMKTIVVADGNHYFSSADGVLYNKKQTRLLQFPGAKGGKFKMPDSVKEMEAEAFQFCFRVTNVTISGKITRIPAEAFTYCTRLRTLVIPSRVKSIGGQAFEGCTALNTVTIGKGMKNIYKKAFSGCNSLQTVRYLGSKTEWKKIAISKGNGKLTRAKMEYRNKS